MNGQYFRKMNTSYKWLLFMNYVLLEWDQTRRHHLIELSQNILEP